MDSECKSDLDDEMIMDQSFELNPSYSVQPTFDPWVISLDEIESGMMHVSSIWSEEYLKYVTGSKFKEDLKDMVKTLDGDLSKV